MLWETATMRTNTCHVDIISSDPYARTKAALNYSESQRLLRKKSYALNGDLLLDKAVICSSRLLWVWLVSFIFMAACQTSSFTFEHFMYMKLQKESFSNVTTDIQKSLCDKNTSSKKYEIQETVQEETVQENAAEWGIYFYLAGGVVAIISNFMLGAFTDRFGRKFLFIFPCLGTSFRVVFATVGMQLDFPLYYYVIGYFVEGCTGQVVSMFQASFIYSSDITFPGRQRSFAIFAMEIAFGLGTALPALGTGYFMSEIDNVLIPMYVSCGLMLITFLSMITLPETFPEEVRAKRKHATYFENLKDSIDLYISRKNYGRRWLYIVMLAVFGLTSFDSSGRTSVEGLYLLDSPFCFGPDKIGVFNALKSGLQQISGIAIVAILLLFTKCEIVAIIGCISYAAAFIIESSATSEKSLYIGISLEQ